MIIVKNFYRKKCVLEVCIWIKRSLMVLFLVEDRREIYYLIEEIFRKFRIEVN
jgi:hypothetical protein